ncbi:MAG: Hpt domain-containing protein [Xanthobacteraceae bacterium]|jgi:chemotaxis protein histidine kinase CheA
MANSMKDTAAVKTFADHEVILPPNKLKKAVVRVAANEPDPIDPVARAEQALADLSGEFSDWMEKDCAHLDAARREVEAGGLSKATCDDLYRAAHDIRGQAETFGYPSAAPVADSLCRLLEHTPDLLRIPLLLINQHVDAIRAIVHQNAQGSTEEKARRLGQRLRQVTDEFLIHENRERPDYLESIFAPPIAPAGPAG